MAQKTRMARPELEGFGARVSARGLARPDSWSPLINKGKNLDDVLIHLISA